jgi:hypothetical protein
VFLSRLVRCSRPSDVKKQCLASPFHLRPAAGALRTAMHQPAIATGRSTGDESGYRSCYSAGRRTELPPQIMELTRRDESVPGLCQDLALGDLGPTRLGEMSASVLRSALRGCRRNQDCALFAGRFAGVTRRRRHDYFGWRSVSYLGIQNAIIFGFSFAGTRATAVCSSTFCRGRSKPGA